jgi:hypothetical protein
LRIARLRYLLLQTHDWRDKVLNQLLDELHHRPSRART